MAAQTFNNNSIQLFLWSRGMYFSMLFLLVVCLAFGLFGLLLLFLTGSVNDIMNLTLVSIILMVVLYPRKMAEGNL